MAMNTVVVLDNSDGTGLNIKQKGTNGAGHVKLDQLTAGLLDPEIKTVIIDHIPANTTAATNVEASSWIALDGYTSGVIHVDIDDEGPAGDLVGTVQIKYSKDGGVTETGVFDIATIANIGANDTQDIFIEFGDLTGSADTAGFTRLIKGMPFFKVNVNFSAGTLASVDVACTVTMRK